jgi:outer membrane lipoprotein
MKALLVIAASLVVAGCAVAPKPLQGDFSSLLPEQASAGQPVGERVRWGGSVVSVETGATETCIEILGRDLGDSARPRRAQDESAGRFLACRAGFYDPAIFTPEREVTVTGAIAAYDTRRIGEYDYRYPRVAADVIYLWPERRDDEVYYASPFWPTYRPFGWGGYYMPVRVPRHKEAAPKP